MITSILSSTDLKIKVVVKSRKKTYFDGEALAVSSINESGEFDILPQHANFITMIQDYVRILMTDSTTQEIPLKVGVMRVFENTVSLYLTVA